jgi:hypothetical protein
MKLITGLLVLFTSALLGFASDAARESQVDDVREAVFRYQFDHSDAVKVIFISVGENGGDPSDEFMKRFADHKPPVRKESSSHFVIHKGVLDKKTGERGVTFFVRHIRWISDTEVEVTGGYFFAELGASVNVYTVKKSDGIWKITKEELKAVA